MTQDEMNATVGESDKAVAFLREFDAICTSAPQGEFVYRIHDLYVRVNEFLSKG